ncbi:MAG: gliding motility-associated C-terminal domain-containing protein [Muribaculaceae bacterium]|nr:gliding motility-associated C-terminal domain-containing protein [Muribaculaceae bacterium]
MNKTRRMALCAVLSIFAAGAHALDFQNTSDAPVEVTPEASTGLERLYVVRSAAGVRVSYPSATARWSKFGAAGGAYAESMQATAGAGESSIVLGAGDCGIIVDDGGRQHCYWITDYAGHEFHIDGLNPTDGDYACDYAVLGFRGEADAIRYYSINGRELILDREITVSYPTLVYDEEAEQFVQAEHQSSMAQMNAASHVPAPLCDTQFTVSGDRFLRAWEAEQSAQSPTYRAVAVDARTQATQTERDADNEQDTGISGLGGSAPCEITFSAETTDAVAFREWQISRTADFDINENTFSDNEFSYTFTENGTMYVRFTAANADGTCTYTGETYEVSVGESKLLCPNAFTPHTSPGVNDEWRVSYQSIVEFKCDIFNRWGTKMITLTDPSQGWDGTHGGKKVAPGVYYYVIRAKGADGRDYKLSGDINIIGSRERSGTVTNE